MLLNLDAAAGVASTAKRRTEASRSFNRRVFDTADAPFPAVSVAQISGEAGRYLGFLKDRLEARGLRYFDAGRDVYKVT